MKSAQYFLNTNIAGIPAGIVNNHNEVLYYWVKSGITGATLFRVDAHHDLLDYYAYPLSCNLTLKSYKEFSIANFNCPAVQQQIINSIYWHNPHSQERKLQDLGTTREEAGRRKIGVTVVERVLCCSSRQLYIWADTQVRRELYRGIGTVISPTEIKISNGKPLIADFDLDGFCCDAKDSIDFLSRGPYFSGYYDGVFGFEARVDESIAILKQLPKPELITVARSVGHENFQRYVPADKVDQVQECLIEKLKQIY